jgi:hypothetical protein
MMGDQLLCHVHAVGINSADTGLTHNPLAVPQAS